MFIVLHINGHFSLLLVNMFLSLVAYDNLLSTNMNDDDDDDDDEETTYVLRHPVHVDDN